MSIFERFKNYLKETRQELRHVNWPTRRETIRFTLLVLGISAVIAAFLGLLDILFRYLLDKLVL
ncbi:MAG: preprotein translocase subunit SecE [bacterium]|nr:preprotein translocase subunit SecE [bacterium]